MDKTNRVVEKYGMKTNTKQSNVINIGRSSINVRITVDGVILQLVEGFQYLGLGKSAFIESVFREIYQCRSWKCQSKFYQYMNSSDW